jgi:DNA polymerase-1
MSQYERIVTPSGPTDSPLLAFVGEAPGREEALAGKPFVGASGRLLTQLMSKAGINRSECYLTNVVHRRPPGNNFNVFYQTKNRSKPTHELLEAWARLRQELAAVQPKLIVPLGAEALYALTGQDKINNWRGTLMREGPMRIIPTYHPAYILRVYNEHPIVIQDFKKAKRQAEFPYVPVVNFNLDPTFSEVMHQLAQRPRRIAVDIETFGTPPLHRCIGIAWSRTDAMCIPFVKNMVSCWGYEEEMQILTALRDLLESPDTEKVLQNYTFDRSVLEKEFGISVRPIIMDTMTAYHTLHIELAGVEEEETWSGKKKSKGRSQKGLKYLSSLYTDHHMYWDVNWASDKLLAEYNCYDCVITYEISEKLDEELRQRKLYEFYHTQVHPATFALARMSDRGIRVDTQARRALELQVDWEVAQISKEISELVGEDFNPHSPKQVADLLYHKWGLPPQTDRETGRETTGDDAIMALARKFPSSAEVINKIIQARRKKILKTTFLNQKLKNGRALTSYNPTGTVTARLSSRKTIEGYGGNLQNLPRGEFRRLFCSDPGKILIKADLSQAEYRVLIWLARIQRIIDRYTDDPGFNIHRWNAAENIFQKPAEEVTYEEYSAAKCGVYGANYGVGPKKISMMYNMDYDLAEFVVDQYHKNVPEVKMVYQREIVHQLQKTRTLVNPFGRERVFYGRLDDATYRSAYSHLCQSTVADLIVAAIVELDQLGVEMLLQVHDEIVVQCENDPKVIKRTLLAMKKAMEIPLQIKGVDQPLIVPAEFEIGPNWYDIEEVIPAEYNG